MRIDKRKNPMWECTDELLLQGALAVAERHPEVRAKARGWAQDYIDRMVTKGGEILGCPREHCKLDCLDKGTGSYMLLAIEVRSNIPIFGSWVGRLFNAESQRRREREVVYRFCEVISMLAATNSFTKLVIAQAP